MLRKAMCSRASDAASGPASTGRKPIAASRSRTVSLACVVAGVEPVEHHAVDGRVGLVAGEDGVERLDHVGARQLGLQCLGTGALGHREAAEVGLHRVGGVDDDLARGGVAEPAGHLGHGAPRDGEHDPVGVPGGLGHVTDRRAADLLGDRPGVRGVGRGDDDGVPGLRGPLG
jgi:hypothetical protein